MHDLRSTWNKLEVPRVQRNAGRLRIPLFALARYHPPPLES